MAFRIDQTRKSDILRIRANTGLRLSDLVYDGVTHAGRVYTTAYAAGFRYRGRH